MLLIRNILTLHVSKVPMLCTTAVAFWRYVLISYLYAWPAGLTHPIVHKGHTPTMGSSHNLCGLHASVVPPRQSRTLSSPDHSTRSFCVRASCFIFRFLLSSQHLGLYHYHRPLLAHSPSLVDLSCLRVIMHSHPPCISFVPACQHLLRLSSMYPDTWEASRFHPLPTMFSQIMCEVKMKTCPSIQL
jgi:hypothetical protein